MHSTMPKKEKAMKTTASIASKKRVVVSPKKHDPIGNAHDPKYMDFLSRFESAFFFEAKKGRLFTTDVPGKLLWRSYLRGFPPGKRQHYKCNACRHFVERFGGLVTIDAEGKKFPALWSVASDPAYAKSFAAMSDLVSASRVTGVFFSDLSDLGSRETGPWRHLAVVNPMVLHVTKLKDAHQAAAEKLEEFKIVRAALEEYPLTVMRKAFDLASTGLLARPEKIKGPLQWLCDLKERTIDAASMEGPRKHRLASRGRRSRWLLPRSLVNCRGIADRSADAPPAGSRDESREAHGPVAVPASASPAEGRQHRPSGEGDRRAGAIVDVTAVTLRPHMWHGIEFPGEGKGAVFVLRGAHDSRAVHCGNALFPETLRPELREIRATIEAYSKGQRLGGTAQASANGLAMVNGPLGTEVIVTSASGLLTSWTIDRWD